MLDTMTGQNLCRAVDETLLRNVSSLILEAYNFAPMKFFQVITPQLIITAISGGLAGSVLTLYVNRPNPTIITYNVTTTSLGADATLRGLIPGLKIQIGNNEVPVI